MRKIFYTLILFSLVFGFSSCVAEAGDGSVGTEQSSFIASNPSDENSFVNLVWSDEFGDNYLKRENWNYDVGRGNWGWGNNELQYYTEGDNVLVQNGMLKIICEADYNVYNRPFSGRINSKGLKEFKYGRLVARLCCSADYGSWPAFWCLGANIDQVNWPACGEIDIFENVNGDGKAYGTLHWGGDYGDKTRVVLEDWHEYELVWTDKEIKMFVDGTRYFLMDIRGCNGIFNRPFFILFNYAVGGNWPGTTDLKLFDGIHWEMWVDYIRLYQ